MEQVVVTAGQELPSNRTQNQKSLTPKNKPDKIGTDVVVVIAPNVASQSQLIQTGRGPEPMTHDPHKAKRQESNQQEPRAKGTEKAKMPRVKRQQDNLFQPQRPMPLSGMHLHATAGVPPTIASHMRKRRERPLYYSRVQHL